MCYLRKGPSGYYDTACKLWNCFLDADTFSELLGALGHRSKKRKRDEESTLGVWATPTSSEQNQWCYDIERLVAEIMQPWGMISKYPAHFLHFQHH